VQIGGGLLLASGKLPRLASAALALSVVPGSLGGHTFWSESDPQRKADERRAFLTDISLIGGLIIAAVDTEGKPSLGWRGRRAAHKVSEAVTAALPVGAATGGALADSQLAEKVGHGLQVGAERGREVAHVARERGAEIAEVARERGPEWAELARKRSAEIADVARERGPELAELARKRSAEIADVARGRGAEWADVARERAPELADTARGRATDLADTARTHAEQGRKQVKQARKQVKRESKRLRS
jgi:gas vesicle protein